MREVCKHSSGLVELEHCDGTRRPTGLLTPVWCFLAAQSHLPQADEPGT